MQRCRPLSFFHTSTTTLHHGLWLDWIVPASNISFTCACTLFHHQRKLWNLSLKGSLSMPWSYVLLRLYSLNNQVPGKRCCDTQPTGLGQPPNFCLTTHLGQTNPAAVKKFLPLFSHHLSLLDTLYLIQFLQSIVGYFSWGYGIQSNHVGDFVALDKSNQGGHQVFHNHPNSLAPRTTSVYVFTTLKPWGK